MTSPTPPSPLRVGLLPCYLKLYDDLLPQRRASFDPFLLRVADGLRTRGLTVRVAPVCRLAAEFASAMTAFEADVDAVVILHLAYSPSLEALDALCRSSLPLVLLDTSMDAGFGTETPASRIFLNHGIHGVMDLANRLLRRRRLVEIVAGHLDDGRCFERAAARVRAAVAARQWQGSTVVRLGPTFDGMGDFAVDPDLLRSRFGITVCDAGIEALDQAVLDVTPSRVEDECRQDQERFDCDLDVETHRRSVRVGLGLRQLLTEAQCQAFSVNFLAFDGHQTAAETMPFLEISKAMARGIGYAGEGDVLTAALVGALARAFGAATFTEIFCADWAGGTLFLSHMGEINPALIRGRPRLFAKPFLVPGVPDTAVLTGPLKPGPATFVNLAPGPADTFRLILAPVDVLPETESLDAAMRNTVRAWIRPRRPVADFLETYSRHGGTHHSALVPGDCVEALGTFGRQIGASITIIDTPRLGENDNETPFNRG